MKKHIITEYINSIEKQLQERYQDPVLCNQYAWWMLEEVTGKKKAALLFEQSIDLTSKQEKTIDQWISQQIIQHVPLQYLFGWVPFNGLKIFVKPPVLIPRPETEEWVIQLIKKLEPIKQQKLYILDLCTGSGCVALALAKALPQSLVFGSDISDKALALAEKNAKHNNIENVRFIKSDLFNTLPSVTFDIIVANPPYISTTDWNQLDKSVTKWEDRAALVANQEGLAVIAQIIIQARHFIKPNAAIKKNNIPQLSIEIGSTQFQKVVDLFKAAGYINIKVKKDLEGKERVVSGSIPYVATITPK